jgi:preprotein translocase subunit SecD
MKLFPRVFLIIFLTIVSGLYIFPWDQVGITAPDWVKPYKYGLDLHGGVELDYKVDLSELQEANKKSDTQGTVNESTVVDTLKTIIDKRVNSLGLAEPTIQTANYGNESHIIVQIPTQDYGNISDSERKKRSEEDIARAKATIGKVVQLEFREEKEQVTDADRAERKAIAEKALMELQTTPFATV